MCVMTDEIDTLRAELAAATAERDKLVAAVAVIRGATIEQCANAVLDNTEYTTRWNAAEIIRALAKGGRE